MIEYKPLIRLVGTVVLNRSYLAKADFSGEEDSFPCTFAVNSLIGNNFDRTEGPTGEEADAGAGGGQFETSTGDAAADVLSACQQPENTNESTPNLHLQALLDMLRGSQAYSPEESTLASMLVASILENDAIDDRGKMCCAYSFKASVFFSLTS